jgi:hypothetical protein
MDGESEPLAHTDIHELRRRSAVLEARRNELLESLDSLKAAFAALCVEYPAVARSLERERQGPAGGGQGEPDLAGQATPGAHLSSASRGTASVSGAARASEQGEPPPDAVFNAERSYLRIALTVAVFAALPAMALVRGHVEAVAALMGIGAVGAWAVRRQRARRFVRFSEQGLDIAGFDDVRLTLAWEAVGDLRVVPRPRGKPTCVRVKVAGGWREVAVGTLPHHGVIERTAAEWVEHARARRTGSSKRHDGEPSS